MRRLGLLCFVAVGSSAVSHASFEMLLVPDATNNRISRFDPINAVGLGGYSLGASRTFISQRGGQSYSYSLSTSRFSVHDYSTGMLVGNSASAFSGVNAMDVSESGSFVFATSNALRELPTLGSVSAITRATISNMATIESITSTGTDYWFVLGREASGNITMATVNKTTFAVTTSSISIATVDSDLGTAAVHLAANGSRSLSFAFRTAAAVNMRSVVLNSNGPLSDSLTEELLGYSTTANSVVNAVSAHNGFWFVGRDSGGSLTRLSLFDADNIPRIQSTYTTSVFSTPTTGPWSMANVVAPEPGTMVALGVGLATLIRRKRGAK